MLLEIEGRRGGRQQPMVQPTDSPLLKNLEPAASAAPRDTPEPPVLSGDLCLVFKRTPSHIQKSNSSFSFRLVPVAQIIVSDRPARFWPPEGEVFTCSLTCLIIYNNGKEHLHYLISVALMLKCFNSLNKKMFSVFAAGGRRRNTSHTEVLNVSHTEVFESTPASKCVTFNWKFSQIDFIIIRRGQALLKV